jgi:hypothetical protein
MAEQEQDPHRTRLILRDSTGNDIHVPAAGILIDCYLEVESVRAGPDTGDFEGVEVRATNLPDDVHWRSLRYHAPTRRAPRARDMLRIIVLALSTPPTEEQVIESNTFSEQ